MIRMTRKVEFSAAHFYHNPNFSAEENRRVFGKCNNPHGHGHNYVLEVTVAGEPDPETGMVLDLKELKDILQREVMDRMDHRHLNYEVPELAGKIPTCENIAAVIWELLEPKITKGSSIACGFTNRRTCLRIAPRMTAAAAATGSRAERCAMKISLTRRYRFAASHRLHSAEVQRGGEPALYGKCSNPYGHGHNYVVEVTVTGPVDAETG